jgi:hypothetical protein
MTATRDEPPLRKSRDRRSGRISRRHGLLERKRSRKFPLAALSIFEIFGEVLENVVKSPICNDRSIYFSYIEGHFHVR